MGGMATLGSRGAAGRTAVRRSVALGLAIVLVGGAASGAAPAPLRGHEVAAGTVDAALPQLTEDTTRAYIDRVYDDLFGRPVDPSGLATWTTLLMAGTPRRAVADAITSSDEFRTGLITNAYNLYLERDPEPAGLQHWLTAMRQGLTIQQLEAGFLGSPEYHASAGGTDDLLFIEALYLDVLGRRCTLDEMHAWLGHLHGGPYNAPRPTPGSPRPVFPKVITREQMALSFLLSTERLTMDIDAEYQWFLGRNLDPSGKHTWATAIQTGTRYEAAIGSIISSDEYVSHLWGEPTGHALSGTPSETFSSEARRSAPLTVPL